jgi:hypothetical protein
VIDRAIAARSRSDRDDVAPIEPNGSVGAALIAADAAGVAMDLRG